MFGKTKKGKKKYPEMVDSIQGSPKEDPSFGRDPGNYNSYPMEPETWPEDVSCPGQMKELAESAKQLDGSGGQTEQRPVYSFREEPEAVPSDSFREEPEDRAAYRRGEGTEEPEAAAAAGAAAAPDRLPAGAQATSSALKAGAADAEEKAAAPDARDLARIERQKRRKRELRRVRIAFVFLTLCILALGAGGGVYVLEQRGIAVLGDGGLVERIAARWMQAGGAAGDEGAAALTEGAADGGAQEPQTPAADAQEGQAADAGGQAEVQAVSETAAETEPQPVTESPEAVQARQALIAEADLKAAQYDYDGAMGLLKAEADFDTNTELQQKAAEYEAAKAACVEISPDTVSHIFVHSLIVDPSRAFDGDAAQDGYNLNMVTVEEFNKILQSLYDNGYVLVSLHDMGAIDENGKMQRKSIYLPEGKKPLVLSQDDVSYYHSYSGDGFADCLIVDENGDVKNQYTDAAGNTTTGDYDMIPILDAFVKAHPDFSYHGRKGIIALTGYNGVLGYRTDGDYRDRQSLQEDQRAWLEAHPDFDFDAEVAAATEVANAMKANGWEFASHTWGHISVSDRSLEDLQTDTKKWLTYVEPIVGETDMIIFAFGADIGDWTGYSQDNAKFNYLKSEGFDYFCNVDGSTLCWVQFGETYLRQARTNVDGYRMATNPELLAPLFDVSAVYDTNRPAMAEWSQ